MERTSTVIRRDIRLDPLPFSHGGAKAVDRLSGGPKHPPLQLPPLHLNPLALGRMAEMVTGGTTAGPTRRGAKVLFVLLVFFVGLALAVAASKLWPSTPVNPGGSPHVDG
jgi:hypothetical protein